jgi:CRP/FNR family transcriptional regulator
MPLQSVLPAADDTLAACEARGCCAACDARALSICAVLPHPELAQLADCASVCAYPPGAALTRQGDAAEHVFNITEGLVMMSALLADGRRQVLGFLFKGDFVGLSGGATHDFTLQAVTPVQACRFDRTPFRRLLAQTPRLEEELLARASDELRAARAHVTLLGRKTALERVTSFLLAMAERGAALGGPADRAALPMTRTDIADHLGLTTETVSRTLSALRRKGVIAPDGPAALRLLSPAHLAAMAEAA